MKELKKHAFNIFPSAGKEDFDRLVDDITTNGYDSVFPIMMYQGNILDGWNRYSACKHIGIDAKFTEFEGLDNEAISYTMRTNKRRNLSSSQWAAVAVQAEEILQAISNAVEFERRSKQSESLAESHEFGSFGNGVSDNKLSDTKNEHEHKASTKVAGVFNTNRTYVTEAKKLKTENPVAFEQVLNGEKTITEVKKEQKIEARVAMIQQQRDDIEHGVATLPEGLFEVIAIDPPWNYGREYDPDNSRVANPYPEMTQVQLLELQPPFADDSVLFLWTTHQFIWNAKELMDKWGFTYKANIVWDKERIGMGAWVRMQCEFCLVGIKGKPTWDNTTWRDIIREARREHSRKPDAFYTMVESVTVGRRLEYFSREQRKGWEVFGNDTTKF
jgi:N6-adenosine-specific RNA methylase IME4